MESWMVMEEPWKPLYLHLSDGDFRGFFEGFIYDNEDLATEDPADEKVPLRNELKIFINILAANGASGELAGTSES